MIRAYGGEALFERIENIRAASVDRYRGIDRDATDGPDHGLEALGLDDTLAFVRSFMLFSMLANLAEDRQGGLNESGPGPGRRRCSAWKARASAATRPRHCSIAR